MPIGVTARTHKERGISNAFGDTYKRNTTGVEARLANVMRLGIPSDKETEKYVAWQSAPHMRRRDRGDNAHFDSFGELSVEVRNLWWQNGVEWHKHDEADDQTSSLRDRASDGGKSAALIPERVFFQMIRGATDPDLLPAVPNAMDGVALYSTTNVTGAARFGATSGNLLTGSGVATTTAILADFFSMIAQFGLFQDTEGQPLYHEGDLDTTYVIFYGYGNLQIFQETFLQKAHAVALAGPTGATPSNIVLDTGVKVELRATSRITDNDWFCFLKGARSSIFEQDRQKLEETRWGPESDLYKDTGYTRLQWEMRRGYGIGVPFDTIKVDN